MTNIAVLITCHNRKLSTLKCISKLYEQHKINKKFTIQIYLVDDNSIDGTSYEVKKQFPEVNIIFGDGKLYWNRGMHLAWATAYSEKDYDYYFWLNDDTFLYEDALCNLIKFSIETNNQSAICGSTYSDESNSISYGGYTINGKIVIPNGNLQEVYSFNGNIVLVPKYVFNKVGNLNSIYPHAIGDFDYALRIRKIGLFSYVLPYYAGMCDNHSKIPIWGNKNYPFFKRLKNLYSPLGYSHPYYYFNFELEHYGLVIAIKHLFSIHLRLFFPKLWLKIKYSN
jgi:GT2 family glycosyltransferase